MPPTFCPGLTASLQACNGSGFSLSMQRNNAIFFAESQSIASTAQIDLQEAKASFQRLKSICRKPKQAVNGSNRFAGSQSKLSTAQTDLQEAKASLQRLKSICRKPKQAFNGSNRFAGSQSKLSTAQTDLQEAKASLQRLRPISGTLQRGFGYENFIALQACINAKKELCLQPDNKNRIK
ncbi:MAG: hypothetical protein LBD21_10645 [Tannerellaceae bacterium]|jgi:multidrug efflux pump subunit AcrA (membrane-fusion protein)|nr:hypothetical protein [Tannerellaceae bacterium]